MSARIEPSSLLPDANGIVELLLVQAPSGDDVVGKRHALAHKPHEPPTGVQIATCQALLESTRASTLTVMSYHPGLRACGELLSELAQDRTVVGLEGVDTTLKNRTVVATSGSVTRYEKVSLSSEDEAEHVQRGSALHIFEPQGHKDAVRWAILNCHEYSHIDLLLEIQKHQIELLIVVTYNAATRLFWQYAVADVHRLFCYVVICNVAELGGSGVFAPFRRIGREANAQFAAAGQIFGARGPAELSARIRLEIGELRNMRRDFRESGFAAPQLQPAYASMVPSEHFIDTFDHGAGAPACETVEDVPYAWRVTHPRVAIAQLDHVGLDVYHQTKYRIRHSPASARLTYLLSLRLAELELRCSQMGRTTTDTLLDLLVLPEVFVPRSFLPVLQNFSNRTGAVVVAGLDYPGSDESENANECAILRPDQSQVVYRKITRSQYDALRTDRTRMPMLRGSRLVRFTDEQQHGFGVLICYDFSHFDLIWRLNMENRLAPLDMTIIIAHNPFGELYRSSYIADAHRFYQYVIMCNVADYGGSGIFAPQRTPGARQVLMDVGKGVETIAVAELDLAGLQKARTSSDASLHDGVFMRRPGVFQTRWP